MRAESFGAAAASLALGAVLVVSSLAASELLLRVPENETTQVVETGPAFDTVDVAHLLETETSSPDARGEPRPSTPSTPEEPAGAPGSGTLESRGPALAEAGTEADDVPADNSASPRPAPQPSLQPEPPRQPGDSERRAAEPSAPAPRIRALSGSSGSTRSVVEPAAPDAGPSTRGDRAPERPRARDDSPRDAAPSVERRAPERAAETPAADAADAREPVEQGAETTDERVRPASLETSPPRLQAGEPTPGADDAVPPHATARDLEELEPGKPEEPEAEKPKAHKHKADKHKADKHKADKHKADKHKADKPRADKHKAQPATPATPAEPKPGAGERDRPPQDPPPVEPATPAAPATPAQPAADPAAGRGPADEATDADG